MQREPVCQRGDVKGDGISLSEWRHAQAGQSQHLVFAGIVCSSLEPDLRDGGNRALQLLWHPAAHACVCINKSGHCPEWRGAFFRLIVHRSASDITDIARHSRFVPVLTEGFCMLVEPAISTSKYLLKKCMFILRFLYLMYEHSDCIQNNEEKEKT